MTNVLAAEWIKLRSVRSTATIMAVLGAFVCLSGLWSWYVAGYYDGLSPERAANFRAAPAEQPLVLVLPVCAAVLGGLAITAEYSAGTIKATLAAIPGRLCLFAAKAAVTGGLTLVAGLSCVTAAMSAGRLIVGDRPVPSFEATVAEQVPHLLAVIATAVVITLVGCGAGTVLRSTAGAITALMLPLMVLPAVAGILPFPWDERVQSVLPLTLPGQIAAPPTASGAVGTLSPAAAAAVLALYAVIALALGAFSFVQRDA